MPRNRPPALSFEWPPYPPPANPLTPNSYAPPTATLIPDSTEMARVAYFDPLSTSLHERRRSATRTRTRTVASGLSVPPAPRRRSSLLPDEGADLESDDELLHSRSSPNGRALGISPRQVPYDSQYDQYDSVPVSSIERERFRSADHRRNSHFSERSSSSSGTTSRRRASSSPNTSSSADLLADVGYLKATVVDLQAQVRDARIEIAALRAELNGFRAKSV